LFDEDQCLPSIYQHEDEGEWRRGKDIMGINIRAGGSSKGMKGEHIGGKEARTITGRDSRGIVYKDKRGIQRV